MGTVMSGDLCGKRVLITGGHRGIGRAIAEAFVDAGAHAAIAGLEGAEQASRPAAFATSRRPPECR